MILIPKNWAEFQHYKDRAPPWIKLHKKLLDDRVYQSLPLASRALAPMLWLLASESKDGSFDGTHEELAFRLRTNIKDIAAGLKPLIDKGFFTVAQGDSAVLAGCQQLAVPETEAEREAKGEAERSPNGSRIPADWEMDAEDKAYCQTTRPDLNPDAVALDFAQYWKNVPGAKGRKLNWRLTWQTWVRGQVAKRQAFQDKNAIPRISDIWHESAAGVAAKAAELGLDAQGSVESHPAFKSRVLDAAHRLEHV